MNKYKTIIIFDWDDTLFPTSWVVENSLDLTDINTQTKFIIYFSRLDRLIHSLLSTCINYGTVFIVTNAAEKWITTSNQMLPHTQKLIKQNIKVVSARDTYQDDYPGRMDLWKKNTFQDITDNKSTYQHIISVGDADHEFNALTDLYNKESVTKKRLLKTIRCIKAPSFNELIDELEVLNLNIIKIINNNDHMDLNFSGKK